MSAGGWYARRRGAGEHLASGRISLFDSGVHDFLCMNAQSRIEPSSSVPPGIWIGSARKIWLLTARQDDERAIQRSIQKLERIGWIRRYLAPGHRGDYPILISKFVVTDLSGTQFFINAELSDNWKHPKYLPCTLPRTEVSGKCQGTVTLPTRIKELENKACLSGTKKTNHEEAKRKLREYGVKGIAC